MFWSGTTGSGPLGTAGLGEDGGLGGMGSVASEPGGRFGSAGAGGADAGRDSLRSVELSLEEDVIDGRSASRVPGGAWEPTAKDDAAPRMDCPTNLGC